MYREGAAAAGHVEPRRHEGEGARRRPRARRVPSVEGGEGEGGAGGLGEDTDAAGGHGARVGGGVADAVVLEPRVRRLEVLERGGVRVLGREAQLGRDDRDAQLGTQTRGHVAHGEGRARHEEAAVHEQQQRLGARVVACRGRPRRAHHLELHPARVEQRDVRRGEVRLVGVLVLHEGVARHAHLPERARAAHLAGQQVEHLQHGGRIARESERAT